MVELIGFGVLVVSVIAGILALAAIVWLWENDILKLILFFGFVIAIIIIVGIMLYKVCHYLGMQVLT